MSWQYPFFTGKPHRTAQLRGRSVEVSEMNSKEETKLTKTPKGEQTKALILNSALDLLRDRGYERTTMRAIAKKAGVSLGNAYHYYGSKDHLIQTFYHRTHEEHLAASLPVLEKESSLKARLLAVMRLKISTLEPYHQFAGVLFKTAGSRMKWREGQFAEARPVHTARLEVFLCMRHLPTRSCSTTASAVFTTAPSSFC